MTAVTEDNKPGILMVGNFLSRGVGNRGVCEDLAAKLARAGYSVVTTSERLGRIERLSDMLSSCWRFRHNYDLAHVDVYSGPAFFWAESACWLLRRLRKPYILTLHGGKLPGFSAEWPRRVRRLLKSAAMVTAPSRYLQQQLRSFDGDIVLLPNALDIGNYRYRSRSAIEPALVWLRAFHNIYNPVMAVEVAGILRKTYPGLTLTMAGPDKKDGSLEQVREMTSRLDLEDAVRIRGKIPKDHISELIDGGDIFLNTTNADNTPVSVLEAMACGACVVSTNVGGLGYLLDHEQNALLVEPNNPQAMAAAVTRLLESPALARGLSECARRTSEAFDWADILQEWEAVIQRVSPRRRESRSLLSATSSTH